MKHIFRQFWLVVVLVAVVLLAAAAFMFQGVNYRWTPTSLVIAGNSNYSSPIETGYEATPGAGEDSWVRRITGGGGITLGPVFQLPSTAALADAFTTKPPGACAPTLATTAYAAGSPAVIQTGTANITVLNVTTNTTAGTITLDCDLSVDSRSTSGKGITITGVTLDYGVVTTALSSVAAATVSSLTYPAVGGTAGVTAAGAGGSLTVLPASLITATNTTGKCTPENITFGTPIVNNTPNQRFTLEQVFTTAGSTATSLQVCGLTVYYSNQPF